MATNVILNKEPEYFWNSAYSDIEFVFDFQSYLISYVREEVVGSVGTGYLEVLLDSTWDLIPAKNEYCYITTGTYIGVAKVISSTINSVVLDKQYTANITGSVYIKSLRLPTFSLYKGLKTTDPNYQGLNLPYTLVSSFNYTFNSDIQIRINVKGLLQKIFKIVEPDIYGVYDYTIFNAFRIEWDEESTGYSFVLNSSIPTDELNIKYLNTGLPLTNIDEQIMWGCGNTFFTIFEGGFPKLKIFNTGNTVTKGFNNAFQTNQFSQGFDIN